MERNGSKIIICPFLEGDVLAKTTSKQIRKEELNRIVGRMFVKHKFKNIYERFLNWYWGENV